MSKKSRAERGYTDRDQQARRMEAGAEAFIAANKSDPFCRSRVVAHSRSGISGHRSDGEEAFYDGEEGTETVTTISAETGEEVTYEQPVYRNLRCP